MASDSKMPPMKLHVKVALATDADEDYLGPGVIQLLEGIERTGSIQQAARAMALSYVKALRILNRMERGLGRTLLLRHKGGAARGSTALTPFARRLMREYAALCGKVRRSADAAFAVFLGKIAGEAQ
ncbi:MAG TPA: LysR family transcriptional regulator [Kiritimatiellia bacterium]|nr:LysR family transcriptional regulator [Kiritimatiellia bacterium]